MIILSYAFLVIIGLITGSITSLVGASAVRLLFQHCQCYFM